MTCLGIKNISLKKKNLFSRASSKIAIVGILKRKIQIKQKQKKIKKKIILLNRQHIQVKDSLLQ
jgi:hypothetical protein